MAKPKNENSGCLWMFLFGILTVFLFVFILVFGFSTNLSLLMAALGAGFLTAQILGRPELKDILSNLFVVAVLFGASKIIKVLITEINPVRTETSFNKSEGVAATTIVENNDTIKVYSSHRNWRDNYGNQFNGYLTVRDKDYEKLKSEVGKFRLTDQSKDFWGALYEHIDETDTPSLDLVMKTFEDIHREKNLNQMEFAEMVVSCIQDIPYSFVFQEPCKSPSQYEPAIRKNLEECPECCIGGISYGIQNPVSFLQNLKGDCDTRTVIIYSILKHFNYDVAILNSSFYRHSILGLNLPGPGSHKVYNGKKYRVWETTAKYFEIGKLSSNFNDINHWQVVLTSK